MNTFFGFIIGMLQMISSLFGIHAATSTLPQLPPPIKEQVVVQATSTTFNPIAQGTLISTTPDIAASADLSRDKFLYFHRGQTVFYALHGAASALPSADFSTFMILSGSFYETDPWALDKNHVYYVGQVIPGADPGSYHLLSGFGYAEDDQAVYWNGAVLSGADSATFAVGSTPNGNAARDKNHVYCNGQAYPANTPATSQCVPPSVTTSAISVTGMTKYTDTDFGFSFWYPTSMQAKVQKSQPTTVSKGYEDSTWVNGPGTQILGTVSAPDFTAYEVYSPDMSILSSVDAGCCGSNYDKYFFDAQQHTWMYADDGGPKGGAGGTNPADTSNNTMGGLHIFSGYTRFSTKVIIPLSAHNFLAIYMSCDSETADVNSNQNCKDRFNTSVQTILATDPSVATPVSAAQQQVTIQAEKDVYEGILPGPVFNKGNNPG